MWVRYHRSSSRWEILGGEKSVSGSGLAMGREYCGYVTHRWQLSVVVRAMELP